MRAWPRCSGLERPKEESKSLAGRGEEWRVGNSLQLGVSGVRGADESLHDFPGAFKSRVTKPGLTVALPPMACVAVEKC